MRRCRLCWASWAAAKPDTGWIGTSATQNAKSGSRKNRHQKDPSGFLLSLIPRNRLETNILRSRQHWPWRPNSAHLGALSHAASAWAGLPSAWRTRTDADVGWRCLDFFAQYIKYAFSSFFIAQLPFQYGHYSIISLSLAKVLLGLLWLQPLPIGHSSQAWHLTKCAALLSLCLISI